jgi:predicted nucleic-acid-binding protein
LTIIAVYAARMDYQNCEADVRSLVEILERHPMFVARKDEIFSLINKYVNSMEAGDPDKALIKAADALTRVQKNIAFELAVEVARPEKELTGDEKQMFDTLQARLTVDNEFAEKAFDR